MALGKNPEEILGEFQQRWAPQIDRVSLVAELEFTKEELKTALFCCGHVWKSKRTWARAGRRIRASYPAAFVVSLAGGASYLYEGRAAWPAIFDAAGLGGVDANLSTAWGRCFLECLDRLGLPTFPELDDENALKYVARLLLHGGLPIDHLDEWWEVAAKGMRQLETRDATALHSWLVTRAEAGRLYGATTAVERFLRFGGEFAVDFLDRSLDLLEHVQDGDGFDDIRVGLPRRYVERGLELREEGLLPGDSARTRGTSSRGTRAELRFDPYGLGVHLSLPPVRDAGGPITWNIALGESIKSVTVRPSRPGLPTDAAEILLPSNVTELEVSRSGTNPSTMVAVDPSDPILLFEQDGRHIGRSTRLPRDLIWCVRPRDADLESEGARTVETHETVPRWEGWVADLFDLADASQLRLDGGRRHLVEADRSARLVGLDPVLGIATEEGRELSFSWPSIQLPGSDGGSSWHVNVLDEERNETADFEYEVGEEDLEVSLEDMVPELARRPIRITARGPLGRSLRRETVVVPALELRTKPSVRKFVSEGLSPCRVTVSGVEVPDFVMDPDERSRLVDAGDGLRLVVQPPAVAVQYVRSGDGAAWSYGPLTLELESVLEDPGHLFVRLPGEPGSARLLLHDTDGAQHQMIRPTGTPRNDGSVLFDISRFTDTLGTVGAAALAVESHVWSGRLATVLPGQVAKWVDVNPTRGSIQLVGISAPHVQAALYARLIPTRDPVIVDVPTGDPTIPMPHELIGLGPLRLLLRIEDPWVPSPWPDFPAPGPNVHDLHLDWDLDTLHHAHPLAAYLADEDDLPANLEYRVGDALRLFTLAQSLDTPRHSASVRSEIGTRLAEDPAATLQAALDIGLSGSSMANALADTGLVSLPIGATFSIDDIERLWTRWPGAGVLAAYGHLWERTDQAAAVRHLVTERCGEAATELLSGGDPEVLALPRFDNPGLIEWSVEQLQALRAEANIVPKTLLDSDSRADDGFSVLIRMKESSALKDVVTDAETIVWYALERIFAGGHLPVVEAAIRERAEGDHWQLLPAASLALAATARLAARSPDPSKVYNAKSRRAFERLATSVPNLAAADLVMAELAIQGATGD